MYSNGNATYSPRSGSEDSNTSISWLSSLHHTISADSQQGGELVDCELSDELDGPPDDLTYHIWKLQIDFVNWRLDWGETNWETEFADQLRVAQQEGQTRNFVNGVRHIVRAGRDLLDKLKFLGEVSCNNTPVEIRDLFLQGYNMVIAIALQVKFFEVKLYQISQDPIL